MDPQFNISNAQTVKVSHHDPRGDQLFLQFSHDMCSWNIHGQNHTWWLAREVECHELFQKYGYNLYSGMWFCLIACKRRGWVGLANALNIFANNFIDQKSLCWPPLSEPDVRRQILNAYCNHVIPLTYTLQVSEVSEQTLQEILSSTKLLQQISVTVKFEQRIAFQQAIVWLISCIKSLGKKEIKNNDTPTSFGIRTQTRNWRECIISGISGAIISVFVLVIVQDANNPEILIASNNVWKDNPLFTHWQVGLKTKYHSDIDDNTSEQLNHQLDTLEQRLLDSEKNRRSYITISELKTDIYQMKNTLHKQDSMIENRLSNAEKIIQQQPLPPSSLILISSQINDINNRLLYLKSRAGN